MDYEKTDWKDTSTPVDAEHLNKIEEGIYESNITADAGAKNIASLNDDVSEISKKVTSNEEAINELNTYIINIKTGTYRVKFSDDVISDRAIGVLYAGGIAGAQQLTLLINGYGYSTSRLRVFEVTVGNSFSYEVSDEFFAIDITINDIAGSNKTVLGYFSFYGLVPSFEKLS